MPRSRCSSPVCASGSVEPQGHPAGPAGPTAPRGRRRPETAGRTRSRPSRSCSTHGLDLPEGVTFLVGENGLGKSTLVEAIAEAYGLNPEGGSRNAQLSTRASESPLGKQLQLVKSPGAGRWSFFLRAESMHGLYTYLEGLGEVAGSRLPRDEPRGVVPGGPAHQARRPRLLPDGRARGRPLLPVQPDPRRPAGGDAHQRVAGRRRHPLPAAAARSPARPSSRSARTGCGRSRGRTCSWCRTGGPTSTGPRPGCGT